MNGNIAKEGRLDSDGAVFVVFRKLANKTSWYQPKLTETTLATFDGPWTVKFQTDRGVSGPVTLDRLTFWSDNSNPGVTYFSGTATYTKTIYAEAESFKSGAQLWLDLGVVKDLAEVTLNSRSLGIAWKAPYRVALRGTLQRGDNQLTVKVTNLWVNRLIGDQKPTASRKYTFTTFTPYKADSPLLPSGLLGPVKLLSAR